MTNPEPADHYAVLDLCHPKPDGKAADQNEIKAAYRRALLHSHPDKVRGRQVEQVERPRYTIDKVIEAYNTLVNPSTRLQYDERLKVKRQCKSDRNAENYEGIETIDLDDLVYDSHRHEWRHGCRCGDESGFRVTEDELRGGSDSGEVIAECPGCSLLLRVTYAMADEPGTP